MNRSTFAGWGRTAPALAEERQLITEEEILHTLSSERAVIARGLGRSYGDPAQVSGGVILSNRGMRGMSEISPTGHITVEAGVSIDELLKYTIPQGWFIPVTPGTRQVTLGGALAADVHGKNHHVDGSIAAHVTEIRLVTPVGAKTLSPTKGAALFWATMGAMGLTGIITSVSMQLLPIETDQVLVDTDRHPNLDSVMDAMLRADEQYRYSVAWVDCMTRGKSMGRAILTCGEHATHDEVKHPKLRAPEDPKLTIPMDAPSGILNSLSIKAFNEAWFRKAPRHREREAQSLSTFFHPLDGVSSWNRLYGKRGFLQYQFCVDDQHAETVVKVIDRLSSSGMPSFLAVLKRFGAGNPAPLSFPMPGWTLALDMPIGPRDMPRVLDELDDLVLEAGGRLYFAKDSRLSPDKVRAMYPRLKEFNRIKTKVDPENRLTSDLSRRLRLQGK
jgi:decaprenylphospho-beta-D-ribofuranose 2-oxidase